MQDCNELRNEAFQLFGRVVIRSDPGRLDDWAGLGLTMTQIRVLFILRLEDGLSAGVLAERLSVTPSTVTRIVDRLVRNNLVRRDVGEDDRRLVRHYLTGTGAEVLGRLEEAGRERMNQIFSRLSAEQLERAVAALRDLLAAVEAADAEGRRVSNLPLHAGARA